MTRPVRSGPWLDVDAAPARGFALAEELPASTSPWHAHQKHQLLYSAHGALRLEVSDAQWLLPPERAAWIAAGVRHRVASDQPASLRTIYLAPKLVPAAPAEECQVFVISDLAREMILFATRWGPQQAEDDLLAKAFFTSIAHLLPEWSAEPAAWRLPRARSPELERAVSFVLDHLGEPLALKDAAQAAGTSERTLARRFEEEAHLGFRRFLHDARMLRAMELLSQRGARVTQTAFAVGFESVASFTHAFLAFTGERPKDFRARVAASRGTTGTRAG